MKKRRGGFSIPTCGVLKCLILLVGGLWGKRRSGSISSYPINDRLLMYSKELSCAQIASQSGLLMISELCVSAHHNLARNLVVLMMYNGCTTYFYALHSFMS